MYLKSLDICALNYMRLILLIFFSVLGLAWQEVLKKTKIELDLSTDFNISTMVEKSIRCRICHAIY